MGGWFSRALSGVQPNRHGMILSVTGEMTDAHRREVALERHRRKVVKIVLYIFGLLIFEGVLRKWLLPQFGRPLFFIRDPLVLSIYLMVFIRRVKLGRQPMLEIGCALGLAGAILAVMQQLGGSGVPL